MMSASDLAGMRATVTAIFDTTCAIQRLSGNSYVVSTPSTTCLIFAASGTVTYPGLPRIIALQEWQITLPWNADVLINDRIVTALATYQVQRIDQPSSYNVNTVAKCYQLFDASGNAVYLVPNATISLAHQNGVNVYPSRRVMLDWPTGGDPIQPAGKLVAGYLYDAPDAVYLLNDVVTVTEEDGFGAQLPLHQFTVDLAQHVNDPPLVRVHLVGMAR